MLSKRTVITGVAGLLVVSSFLIYQNRARINADSLDSASGSDQAAQGVGWFSQSKATAEGQLISAHETASSEIVVDDKTYQVDSPPIGTYIVEFGPSLFDRIAPKTDLEISPDAAAQANAPAQAAKSITPEVVADVQQTITDGKTALKSIAPEATIKREFNGTVLAGLVAENLSRDQANQLKKKGYTVELDKSVKATLDESVPLIRANTVWQSKINGQAVTGKGKKIAIVDTGIDYTHPDLDFNDPNQASGCTTELFHAHQCKVVDGYDIINKDDDPKDDQGHGTHVAATAAGTGSSTGLLRGVAPEASLYAYKVLSSDGSGTDSTVIAGMERAVDPDQNCSATATAKDPCYSDRADVINVSLGGSGNPDDLISKKVDLISSIGTAVAVAAGNSGDYGYQTISSPATARKAITVAASDKKDQIASFSSRGPVVWNNKTLVKPDIAAPGVDICAAEHDNAFASYRCKDQSHVAISGTSMATPHIAGVIALMRQAHPDWTVDQVKQVLLNTARPNITAPNSAAVANALLKGAGRVDALGAVRYKYAPPIINLVPLAYSTNTATLPIRASANGKNLTAYQIEYSNILRPSKWLPITQGTFSGNIGKIDTALDLNPNTIPNGDYLLRLNVQSSQDQQIVGSSTLGYFHVNKVTITAPQHLDVVRGGQNIPIKAFYFNKPSTDVKVSWGEGNNPSRWRAITGTTWDTKGLSFGLYTIKAELTSDSKSFAKLSVYVDPTLAAGWPLRVSIKDHCFTDTEGHDFCDGLHAGLDPVLANITGDEKPEIIFLEPGIGGYKSPSNSGSILHVYDASGKELWKKPISDNYSYGSVVPKPVVAKAANGETYIYVHSSNLANSTFDGKPDPVDYSELVAFKTDGTIAWSTHLDHHPAYVSAADLDNDGTPEVIVRQIDYVRTGYRSKVENTDIQIVDSTGKVTNQWRSKGWPSSLSASSRLTRTLTPYVSVGNFDDDPALELAVVDYADADDHGFIDEGKGVIGVYNQDGSSLPGWPVTRDNMFESSPAIGDLDGDGKLEIVIWGTQDKDPACSYQDNSNCGRLWVLDSSGQDKPGWPKKLYPYSRWNMDSPAIGDVTGDGKSEIFSCDAYHGIQCYLTDIAGNVMPGWPHRFYANTMDHFAERIPAIADIDGDAKQQPELINIGRDFTLPLAGGTDPDTNQSSMAAAYAWNIDGTPLSGFLKAVEQVPSSGPSIYPKTKNSPMYLATSYPFAYVKQGANSFYKDRWTIMLWALPNQSLQPNLPWPMFHHDNLMTGLLSK